jgi:translocator protein
LDRPRFAPRGLVFPLVWSALNPTTTTSAWHVRHTASGTSGSRGAFAWWLAAMPVRSAYTPLAFGRRSLWLATAGSALPGAVMTGYAWHAARIDRSAALLAGPEIAWILFATVLSAETARLNAH